LLDVDGWLENRDAVVTDNQLNVFSQQTKIALKRLQKPVSDELERGS